MRNDRTSHILHTQLPEQVYVWIKTWGLEKKNYFEVFRRKIVKNEIIKFDSVLNRLCSGFWCLIFGFMVCLPQCTSLSTRILLTQQFSPWANVPYVPRDKFYPWTIFLTLPTHLWAQTPPQKWSPANGIFFKLKVE